MLRRNDARKFGTGYIGDVPLDLGLAMIGAISLRSVWLISSVVDWMLRFGDLLLVGEELLELLALTLRRSRGCR